MAKPKLNNIKDLLSAGKNFSLTERQYLTATNADLPKDFYYLRNKSAVAKLAQQYGFVIKIQEKTIIFEKENIK